MNTALNLSVAQKYFVDLIRSHLSMRVTPDGGSSYILQSRLGDAELWEDWRLGLNMFNTTPPTLTTISSQDLYNVSQATENKGGDAGAPASEDIISILITPIVMCALFYSGLRLQWFEAGKHFRYNDNGINIERVKQQDYANIVNGDILSYITNILPSVKKTVAFSNIKLKGLFSGMISFPRSLTRGLRGTRIGFGG